MRILHLITRMDGGGSAVNTLISATEQVNLGHDVVLATGLSIESDMSADEAGRVSDGLAGFERAGGVIRRVAPLKRSLGLHDWAAYREIALLMREGFDVVHTHTSKAGVLGRMSANDRARVVHTPHGHIFHGYFGKFKTSLFVAVERWLAGRSDAMIALTHAEKADHLALNIGQQKQWHVVPSGVDVASISEQVADFCREDADRVVWDAVSVGRLVPIKGMDRLIRAWAEVCRVKPDARLAIVGDGDQRQMLETLAAELGITENIHFAGWSDPLPYLAKARCFALLSHNEGMGRAVIEAFAASLACVVSDVCGLSELVDDEVGRVVDADNRQAVAAALLTEWDMKIGKQALKRAESYSVKTMIDGLERVYHV